MPASVLAQESVAPRRRPGGRSARVRAAVLHATIDELAAVGYPRLGFDGIARRAGVHKTTLYRRWPTREALVVEALLELSAARVPMPDTGSLRGDLLVLANAVRANITSPEVEAVLRALVADATRLPVLADAGRQYWPARFAQARRVVDHAIRRGELAAGADADLVIEALIGPLYLRLLVTLQPLEADFVERVVDLVVAGARAGGAGSSADGRADGCEGRP
jgi:AcrR family transcriptional regulator